MGKFYFPVLVIGIFVIGLSLGLFLFLKPALAIELQRRFYEKINWRIEPVSMQKEIRNTRLMGLCLIIICLLIIVYSMCLKSSRWF